MNTFMVRDKVRDVLCSDFNYFSYSYDMYITRIIVFIRKMYV